MPLVDAHVSISLDGFLAGPDQSEEQPLGRGGRAVHAWHIGAAAPEDVAMSEDLQTPRGAYVMGRNMFGPVRDAWTGDWRGWWGDEPPYDAPVFVLTHHAREPVATANATTFHFVCDGFDAAFARARDAAGDGDVRIAGGASTVRQALAAGVLDELTLDIAPVLLGAGERLFDGVEDLALQIVETVASPMATHVRYRVVR